MLLGELRAVGPPRRSPELLPHADRALDGSSGTATPTATASSNTRARPGRPGQPGLEGLLGRHHFATADRRPPIALAEVQGYVYAAYRARAELAREAGDAPGPALDRYGRPAQARVQQAFWLPDKGCYAAALDGDKTPIDALASNIGHCLWTGIVDEDKAAAVADHLLSRTCSPAGASAPWPRRWPPTTR